MRNVSRIISVFIILGLQFGIAKTTPAEYWKSLSEDEKISFVSGVYAASSALKNHHRHEVDMQYYKQEAWVQPYFIERFYEIIDEHISKEVGFNLEIITGHMDALYTNYDNIKIPLVEAVRIVSLVQDGDRQKANLILLKVQQKYKP